jgi:hypothetical protein
LLGMRRGWYGRGEGSLAVTDKTLGDAAPNLTLLLVCISLVRVL